MPAISKAKGQEQFSALEKLLFVERDKLRAHFAEQRTGVFVDREPDDEGAEANRNLATHLLLSNLDRDRRVLGEIERALQRMHAGEYAVCESCGGAIPDVRLRALPWTRFCVQCAERSS